VSGNDILKSYSARVQDPLGFGKEFANLEVKKKKSVLINKWRVFLTSLPNQTGSPDLIESAAALISTSMG